MSAKSFVDTNVLVYAHDSSAGARHAMARDLVAALWEDRAGVVSTQVLQELYVNLRHKAGSPLSSKQAREVVEDYLSWQVVENDARSVLRASEIEERFKVSFWDALILQAAHEAGTPVLWSEDLSDGQEYGTVTVRNPFLRG